MSEAAESIDQARSSMSLLEWSSVINKYASLYANILDGCGESVAEVVNTTFNMKQEYRDALKIVENEEPAKQAIIMEFIGIRRVVHTVMKFLIDKEYDVLMLSPEIWYPTWLIASNSYRAEPADDDSLVFYETKHKINAAAKTYATEDHSCFVISDQNDLLVMCYKNSDKKSFGEFGSDVLSAGGFNASSMEAAFEFMQRIGYKPVSWMPLEKELLPTAWVGTDKDDSLVLYTHASVYKKPNE